MRFALAAVLAVAVFSFCPTPADAREGRLVGLGGASDVFVWRNRDAHNEANRLINAGIHRTNPRLLVPLVACIVPSGTGAIITGAGMITQDILVTSGSNSGCRGNIPTESFRSR